MTAALAQLGRQDEARVILQDPAATRTYASIGEICRFKVVSGEHRVRPVYCGLACGRSSRIMPVQAPSAAPAGKPQDRRKLIAVVYADMVGYSRLIGLDDAGTLERLRLCAAT